MSNYYLRKIRCPRHFMLKTGIDPRSGMRFAPFKMQINPQLMNLPEWAFKKWPSLLKFIPYHDRFGRKVRDHKSFFQPLMSAAFFVHQVYDPKNHICKVGCKGRCLEGLGIKTHKNNKRLQGAAGE